MASREPEVRELQPMNLGQPAEMIQPLTHVQYDEWEANDTQVGATKKYCSVVFALLFLKILILCPQFLENVGVLVVGVWWLVRGYRRCISMGG